jgi:hypothetical protein
MKKKNLKLADLKVTSFVTNIEKESAQTIVGGAQSNNPHCPVFVATLHGQGCGGHTLNIQCGTNYANCGTGYETIFTCPNTIVDPV